MNKDFQHAQKREQTLLEQLAELEDFNETHEKCRYDDVDYYLDKQQNDTDIHETERQLREIYHKFPSLLLQKRKQQAFIDPFVPD